MATRADVEQRPPVSPAQAGIQCWRAARERAVLGPRLRGDDGWHLRGDCGWRLRGEDAYFAMPTAFIVAPSSASDLAMNLPKSSGPAYTTPKPRLAMKSVYSLES